MWKIAESTNFNEPWENMKYCKLNGWTPCAIGWKLGQGQSFYKFFNLCNLASRLSKFAFHQIVWFCFKLIREPDSFLRNIALWFWQLSKWQPDLMLTKIDPLFCFIWKRSTFSSNKNESNTTSLQLRFQSNCTNSHPNSPLKCREQTFETRNETPFHHHLPSIYIVLLWNVCHSWQPGNTRFPLLLFQTNCSSSSLRN